MSPSPGHQDPRYALVNSEAVRALSEQAQLVDNMRTRAGILLSATAIVTSFLGGTALMDGGPTAWGWVAIGLFGGPGLSVLAMLTQMRWVFTVSATSIVSHIEQHGPPTWQLQRDLALYLERYYDENVVIINRRLSWPLRLASLLLVSEVVAWVVDLAVRE